MTLIDMMLLPLVYLHIKIVGIPLRRSNRDCPWEKWGGNNRWIVSYEGTAKISCGLVYRTRDLAEPGGGAPVFLFELRKVKHIWVDAGGSTQHAVQTYYLVFDGADYFMWDPEVGGILVEIPPFFRVYRDWHETVLRLLADVY